MREDTGPVVMAVAGGGRGRDAVEWAAAEASARQCALRIVYPIRLALITDSPVGLMPAYPWQDASAPEVAARILSEAADHVRRVDPAVEITTHVQAGGISGVLREERRAALIVVSRSRGVGRKWLSGGTAGWQAARRAGCPVAIVALSDQLARGPSAGRIVAAADDSDDPLDVFSLAFRAAVRRGVGVTVLRTIMPGCSSTSGLRGRKLAARSRGTVEDALRLCLDAFPGVDVRQRLVGCPAGCDLVAESPGAALIVLGSRRRGRIRRPGLSLGEQDVLRLASSPVVIVR
jgi:nucleotide-binding universal stress UspA family protein